MILKVIILILFATKPIQQSNLSPIPNIFLKPPHLTTFNSQLRSSFFGLSATLKTSHVIIGSPRAQSSLASQKNTTEPGSIFKCDLNISAGSSRCYPFIFDNGTDHVRGIASNSYQYMMRDFQLLGFSMDGMKHESNSFVVCAPKLIADSTRENETDYLLHGICYWTLGTKNLQPMSIMKMSPLNNKYLQKYSSLKTNFYNYGESGFSIHIADDDENVIIGCPGILKWKGSVAWYRPRKSKYSQNNEINNFESYINTVPNPINISLQEDSYFGFAVGSARFLGPDSDKLFFVASAPRVNQTGEVYIFDIPEDGEHKQQIRIHAKLSGTQFGEYFGYALLCEDFNGDELPDIAISAPMHAKDKYFENGVVYVYINKGNVSI